MGLSGLIRGWGFGGLWCSGVTGLRVYDRSR